MNGGWDLVDVSAKSRALFLYRIQSQATRTGTLTAGWMKKWNISQTENPPFPDRIPKSLEYLGTYVMDMAYIPKQADSETAKTYKRNIYKTLRMMNNADAPPQELRITRMYPQANWRQIGRNLTVAPTSEDDKAL
jgi:hypothetical protein